MPVEWGQTLIGVKKCSSIEAEVANGAINAVFISLVFSLFFFKKKALCGKKNFWGQNEAWIFSNVLSRTDA